MNAEPVLRNSTIGAYARFHAAAKYEATTSGANIVISGLPLGDFSITHFGKNLYSGHLFSTSSPSPVWTDVSGWSTAERTSPALSALERDESKALSCRVEDDARIFRRMLPSGIPDPVISVAEDGEIVFDWVGDSKKAIVGLEGDGYFGYTLYHGGRYRPGEQEGDLSKGELPADLRDYLLSMSES